MTDKPQPVVVTWTPYRTPVRRTRKGVPIPIRIDVLRTEKPRVKTPRPPDDAA